MTNDDKFNEIMSIQKICSCNDIEVILKNIPILNNYKDKLLDKLFCLLTKQEEWEYGHCMEFYECLLRKYSSEEELEMLLAVSGVSDNYRNVRTATKRRQKYISSLTNDSTYDEDTYRKREQKAYEIIAKKIYNDFCSGEIVTVIDSWKSQIRPNPPSPPGEKPEKIFIKIKNYIKKIINDKPQYCLGVLVVVVFITMPLLSITISNIYLAYNQRNTTIKDEGTRIQSIFITDDNITLVPGERKNPGIAIAPADADRSHLKHEISNTELVDLTLNWEVVGLSGGQNLGADTAEIDIWGDDAKRVTIYVTVEAEYIDRADDGADVDIKTLD